MVDARVRLDFAGDESVSQIDFQRRRRTVAGTRTKQSQQIEKWKSASAFRSHKTRPFTLFLFFDAFTAPSLLAFSSFGALGLESDSIRALRFVSVFYVAVRGAIKETLVGSA